LHIDLIPDDCADYCPSMVDAIGFEIWMSDISADSLKLVDSISFTDLHEIKNLTNGKNYFIKVIATFQKFEDSNTPIVKCIPNTLNSISLYTPEVIIPIEYSSYYYYQREWHNSFNYVSYFLDSSRKDKPNYNFKVWDVAAAKANIISKNKIYGSDWNKIEAQLLFSESDSLCIYDATTQTKKQILTGTGAKYSNPIWFTDNQNILFFNGSSAYTCDRNGGKLNTTYLRTADFSGKIFPHFVNGQFYMCTPIVSYGKSNTVFRWNIHTNQKDTICVGFGYNSLQLMAVSPDGNKLAIQNRMSGKTLIWVYDIPNQSWYQTNFASPSEIKFNSDGTELLFFQQKYNNQAYKLYSLKI
jgi:hypothetical protein